MDVINSRVCFLSNFEVYQLLKDIKEGKRGYRKPDEEQHELATITYEVFHYLEKTQCRNQTEEQVSGLMTELAAFELTKAEKLQLINLLPKTPVEIQLIVEESEERLSEREVELLLEIISKYSGTNVH